MNSLIKFGKIKYSPLTFRSYSSDFLGKSGWYPEIKPGPYPKTEEEKLAAAKKYGLLREEYEPYPDDGNGYGDYPKVKMESLDAKSDYYDWHDTHFKRLYGETLNVYNPILNSERYSTARQKYSFKYSLSCFLLIISSSVIVLSILDEYKQHHALLEKQFPDPEVVHYTFEFNEQG